MHLESVNDKEIGAIRMRFQLHHAFGSQHFRAAIEAQQGVERIASGEDREATKGTGR